MPSKDQSSRPGRNLRFLGSILMSKTTALAFSSSLCSSSSLRPSGMTWKTEPMVTSDALMSVPSGSFANRTPLAHMVWRNFETFQSPPRFPTAGTSTERGAIARAVTREPLSRPRRPTPIPESFAPSLRLSTAPARASSDERVAWRSSTMSWSRMSVLAQ